MLRIAHIKDKPERFVQKTLQTSVFFALGLAFVLFVFLDQGDLPGLLAVPAFPVIAFLLFMLFVNAPKTKIQKRARALDREVLFAGRFLLVKIHSGRPLLNALIDGTNSYGVAADFFKEIVDDINLGTPIEDALENAQRYSPSEKFRKIMFQINNAIKIGVDVSGPLEETLDEISQQQLIEIQKYGKKLNSLSMFYMLLAIVMPSLGMAILIVIGSLLGIFTQETYMYIFIAVFMLLFIMQIVFIIIFKSSRLSVNL
jgi:pilus assembly protein TadC